MSCWQLADQVMKKVMIVVKNKKKTPINEVRQAGKRETWSECRINRRDNREEGDH